MRTTDPTGASYLSFRVCRFDRSGRLTAVSIEPAGPGGHTVDELRDELRLYLAAIEHGVLADVVMPPDGMMPVPGLSHN